jgi:hypothetical protein
MKRFTDVLALASVLTVLGLGVTRSVAQDTPPPPDRPGRGNFDPAQMQQRMMERYREQMGVTNDDEWKLIETRIQKVQEARRAVMTGGGMGMFGRGGRPPGGDAAGGGNDQGGRRGRGGFGFEPSPEVEALQKAIDSKASKEELKSLMAKVRDARKENEAKLEKAQEELRKVLDVRQEAVAMVNGLLR